MNIFYASYRSGCHLPVVLYCCFHNCLKNGKSCGGRDNATIKKQNKNKNCFECLTKGSQKLASSKGTQTSWESASASLLEKQPCRDQFLLSAMPLAKSLTSAERLGGVLLLGISESVQYTILWSSQGCLWSCWGLCQQRIGACSHYLGRSPSAWGAGQKGWFACADCSNGSLTGRDPSTAQECQLSHCTSHWSHQHKRVLYWYPLWFQKMFLNVEPSSINHTFNAFIKVIPTHLASSTQERSSIERPRTTQ